MIELLDDFTHVGQSCLRFEFAPSDRFAVVALNCALGESADHSRVASLLFVLLTLWFMDRLCYRERDSRRLALWALHPLVLLPFFWASQITTSMTALWGVIWATLYARWEESPPGSARVPLAALLGWSLLGSTVRMEAYVYGLVFLGLRWVCLGQIPWPLRPDWLKRFAAAQAGAIAAMLAGNQLIRFFFPGRMAVLTTKAVVQDALEGANYYPHWLYPFLQLDSLGRYFEGLVAPWRLSFYGDWYQWWQLHQSPALGAARVAAVAVLGALAWRALRRDREEAQRLVLGITAFFGVAAMLSALPRNDWYYPVRAYLAALCFFAVVTPLITRRRALYAGLVVLFALSSAAHLALHYPDPAKFRAYEAELAGGDHPFMDLDQAKTELAAGRKEEALQSLHRLYSKIPVESAQVSSRAATFWTLGLYYAWLIYDEKGDEPQSRKILGILSHSTYFPAIHACLQDAATPVDKCLEGERRANFCNSFSYALPKLPVRRPYRVDPKEICDFPYEIIQK